MNRLVVACFAAALASCSSPVPACGPQTCPDGCCSSAGVCELATAATCGTSGLQCQACGNGQVCLLGGCTDSSGAGGGSAANGGGASSNGGGASSNGGGASSNGGGTSSNGGGTSSNGGGTSSSGGGSAAGGGSSGPCPSVVGSIRVGATWVYSINSSGTTGTSTTTVTSSVAEGSTQVLTYQTHEVTTDSSGNSYDITLTLSETCDADGLHISSVRDDYNYQLASGPVSGWTQSDYSPAFLTYPATVMQGSRWTATSTLTTTTSSSSTPAMSSITEILSITGTQAVDVPAGHFDALVLQATVGTTSTTTYVAPGVGFVEDGMGTEKLTSYTP